jgi:hypothetical protein
MTKRKTLTVQLMELQAQYALLLAALATSTPTATKSVARSTQTVIRDDIECPKCAGTGGLRSRLQVLSMRGQGHPDRRGSASQLGLSGESCIYAKYA